MNTNRITRNITTGLLVGTLALAAAGSAGAEDFEGGGVPPAESDSGDCPDRLLRFLDDHPERHHDQKALAIIGLEGPDAANELALLRTAITERCR